MCAGDGALAAALTAGFKSTTAVEIDPGLEQRLRNRLPDGATVIVGDATKTESMVLPGTRETRVVVANPPFAGDVCGKTLTAALLVANTAVILAPPRCYENWNPPFGTELACQSETLRLRFTNLGASHKVQLRVYRRCLRLLDPADVASGQRVDAVLNKVTRRSTAAPGEVAKAVARVTRGCHVWTVPRKGSSHPPVQKKSPTHHTWYCYQACGALSAPQAADLLATAAGRIPKPDAHDDDNKHNFPQLPRHPRDPGPARGGDRGPAAPH